MNCLNVNVFKLDMCMICCVLIYILMELCNWINDRVTLTTFLFLKGPSIEPQYRICQTGRGFRRTLV